MNQQDVNNLENNAQNLKGKVNANILVSNPNIKMSVVAELKVFTLILR